MIKRINFLEKKRFQVTYRTMAAGIGSVLACCGLLYGLLFLNQIRASARLKALQAETERLTAERERLIRQEIPLAGAGSYVQIQLALEEAPVWSHILDALTRAMPPRTWLASVKSADKAGAAQKKEIILNGQAKNPQAIANFLANLQANPHFDKVTLTTSAEESNGLFQFTISCDISPKKWTLKP
ncbi:MAG: PilN domain-containing protein [Deltaproteobacteria bacterium]|nr:PilN domain-containing protein [Deltaproteobacteria bacterium]